MYFKIAIVGATGVVGKQVLSILEEKNLNYDYDLYASENEIGQKIKLFGEVNKLLPLENLLTIKYDYAIFCAVEEVSKLYVKKLAKKGTRVIDFSCIYRKQYPLIVPEINGDKIQGNIICNPNCSTIGGVMALYNIHKKFGLKQIVYSTYQAVSGAGKNGLLDFLNNTTKCFDYPIQNNIICYIGEIYKNKFTKEENKMIYETRKILNDFDIKINATCVRVPVDVCHGESIMFETKKHASVNQIKEILKNTNGVKYLDEGKLQPMPILVKGGNEVYVGRLRKDLDNKNTFSIFVVSDNLRKGAAQNGVQILQQMLEEKL